MDCTIEMNANEQEQLTDCTDTLIDPEPIAATVEEDNCCCRIIWQRRCDGKTDVDAAEADSLNSGEARIEPLPLERAVDNPEPYPLDALGDTLSLSAKTLYNIVQAPDGICAQIILGYAVHTVQGHAIVEVDGRHYPLNNFFLSIASRSARKSEVDHNAGLVHREIEKNLLAEYQRNFDAYRDEEGCFLKIEKW